MIYFDELVTFHGDTTGICPCHVSDEALVVDVFASIVPVVVCVAVGEVVDYDVEVAFVTAVVASEVAVVVVAFDSTIAVVLGILRLV